MHRPPWVSLARIECDGERSGQEGVGAPNRHGVFLRVAIGQGWRFG
ncbi:MAG: hypothetical protein IT329_08520 [Caldilineaceae bacterium]|nr:hypothetical protein [Caldilineaceae bacterium]